MSDIDELQAKAIEFRDKRNWQRFHNPKDLSISICIEAAELLELFQWNDGNEVSKERMGEEIADIFIYLLSLADVTEIDIPQAVMNKIEKNKLKYPLED
ncbi:MAG: nucleotide pyrophosphohydrolase [Thermoplasmata archaeon]